MIRPWKFHPNPQTFEDNAFQRQHSGLIDEMADKARQEFDAVVAGLEAKGITVHVFDDFGQHNTPDSVFPNNWLSTHPGGHVALYPMYTPNRRRERRSDIIEMLKQRYRVQEVIDFSGLEYDNAFLEGTGAMVFDHIERVVYCANSLRANPIILERFCTRFQYEPIAFDAANAAGQAIYHTNVLLTIATEYFLIGSSMITNPDRRAEIIWRLEDSGREAVHLTEAQINAFAGNALELRTQQGELILAMSQVALNALTPEQIATIEKYTPIVAFNIPTIELAGGSVRCMLAGIHLSHR